MLSKKSIKPRERRLQTKGKLRYSSKKYNNPFFQEKKLKRKKTSIHLSSRFKIIIFILSVLLFLLSAYILYGHYFKIKHINIEGQGHIEKAVISTMAWSHINNNYFIVYPGKNIFIFNSNKLKKELAKKYAFSELRIEKKLPDILNIFYKEKDYAAIYTENEKFYYIDNSGVIISQADLMEVSERDYPIITSGGEKKIDKQLSPISPNTIKVIIDIFKRFKDLNEEFKIERFICEDENKSVKIRLRSGPILIFSSKNDIQKQIDKLKIIKSEKLKGTFDTKKYIDLRFGSSVYYR
ncbi:MAG: cell division protein FtsQ/DivIB [Patescibacteria group bacterium]|nr:cell division protein FtsQ/DivIB [Patescibacteria group bacterium]